MLSKGHGAIAARAVALLATDTATRPLADLLTPSLPMVVFGAWLPDKTYFKSGSGDTQNHVLKMAEYTGPNRKRFVVTHKETLKQLGEARKLSHVLRDAGRLPEGWWDKAYRGDCPRGEHPANCAMGLATTLTDLLLLGDPRIQARVTGGVGHRMALPDGAATSEMQASLYFFMLSHYLADAHMPCHADARPLALYRGKLHARWEEYIDEQVAKFPAPEKVSEHTPEQILERAVAAIPLDFPNVIPSLKSDVWQEVIWICRASFAVNCIIASPDRYPLIKTSKPRKDEHDLPAKAPMPSFGELFEGRRALLEEVTEAILHDAVLSVAQVWKHVWQSVKGIQAITAPRLVA